jgi:hypothetical protein
VADSVLTVLLLLAVGATAVLAYRAVAYWRAEQVGRVYELPVDHRGTALRTGAAGLAAVVAATLGVSLLHTDGSSAPARTVAATASVPAVPPPPPRTPQPAPPAPEVRTVGHPAGGTLQMLRDGTRVWLPPFYGSARAAHLAYPVVIARMDGADPDLYEGFARAARQKHADMFLLVSPPDCGRDSAAVLEETARRYRTLDAQSARGVLGLGAEAPCAVREALANPGRYGAAAGVSGTYPPLGAAAVAAPSPPLLLATAAGESGPRASSRALREELHARGDAVRRLDGVARRRDMFALVAAYMTEKLDGPSRMANASPKAARRSG